MAIRHVNDTVSYTNEAGDRVGAAVVLSQLPHSLLTLGDAANSRLRVDVAQTGFFDGREFRMVRKITAPITYRFTFQVPVIVFEQLLTVSSGSMELYAWAGSNVTPAGTWTNVPFWRKNDVNDVYTPQSSIEAGGTVTPINAELYRDYASVVTSNATAQRFTIGGGEISERYLKAGTYYVQITGTGSGSYSIMYEERP